LAYRKRFQSVMDKAFQWRMSRLGGDPNQAIHLYPELDVTVDLSNTAVTSTDDMRTMWKEDCIISKQTFAEHVLRSKNIPLSAMHLTLYPDGVPREEKSAPKEKTRVPLKKRPREETPPSPPSTKKKKKTKGPSKTKTAGEADVQDALDKKEDNAS